jgi:SAM-dependent methyltransferase
MLAPYRLPERYVAWNRQFGSPRGFRTANSLKTLLLRRLRLLNLVYRWDPFAFQTNSSTRAFEYPWAFEALSPARQRCLEIGGAVSGLQFVLSRAGCHVVNVDPGQPELFGEWNDKDFAKLNGRFGTTVELRLTTIDKANLQHSSFDSAYSISVLEHLPPSSIPIIMSHVWRCLKPGGRFILTVDLFLDLAPFTRRIHNQWGTNINLKHLVEEVPFELEHGNRAELCGFPEFSPENIMLNRESYLVGSAYPVLAQCLVLRKPSEYAPLQVRFATDQPGRTVGAGLSRDQRT